MTWENTSTGLGSFYPADRLIDSTLSAQPCAGRAAGMHPEQQDRDGGRKEWGSTPGCYGTCKVGFMLKNRPQMYIGGRGKGVQCLRGLLTPFSCCLPSSKCLCSFSVASCTAPACVKQVYHPWRATGSGKKAVVSCCSSTGSVCECAGEVS